MSQFFRCTVENCNLTVPLLNKDEHLAFHEAILEHNKQGSPLSKLNKDFAFIHCQIAFDYTLKEVVSSKYLSQQMLVRNNLSMLDLCKEYVTLLKTKHTKNEPTKESSSISREAMLELVEIEWKSFQCLLFNPFEKKFVPVPLDSNVTKDGAKYGLVFYDRLVTVFTPTPTCSKTLVSDEKLAAESLVELCQVDCSPPVLENSLVEVKPASKKAGKGRKRLMDQTSLTPFSARKTPLADITNRKQNIGTAPTMQEELESVKSRLKEVDCKDQERINELYTQTVGLRRRMLLSGCSTKDVLLLFDHFKTCPNLIDIDFSYLAQTRGWKLNQAFSAQWDAVIVANIVTQAKTCTAKSGRLQILLASINSFKKIKGQEIEDQYAVGLMALNLIQEIFRGRGFKYSNGDLQQWIVEFSDDTSLETAIEEVQRTDPDKSNPKKHAWLLKRGSVLHVVVGQIAIDCPRSLPEAIFFLLKCILVFELEYPVDGLYFFKLFENLLGIQHIKQSTKVKDFACKLLTSNKVV